MEFIIERYELHGSNGYRPTGKKVSIQGDKTFITFQTDEGKFTVSTRELSVVVKILIGE